MKLDNAVAFISGAKRGIGLHMGFADTGMAKEIELQKSQPEDIVKRAHIVRE